MPELILPDVVLHNLELERSLQKMERVRARGHLLRSLEDELRGIDPMLSLVRAREVVESEQVRPGFWHVRRCNAPFPDSYLVIESEDGGFVEPHSGVVEEIRRRDTRRAGWFDDFRAERDRKQREREARKRLFHEEIRAELADRIKAYDNPGVSMTGRGRGWAARVSRRAA